MHTVPPMSIQMALSVGAPVKNREMPENNDSEALIPNMISITPTTIKTSEGIGFIFVFGLVINFSSKKKGVISATPIPFSSW